MNFPANWLNPTPPGCYNLVVVGGASSGINSALATARLQGRVALIEPGRSGENVSTTATASSLAMLRSAPAADFALAKQRLDRLQAEAARQESPWRLTGYGIDVYRGAARFTAPQQIEVKGMPLEFDRAILATGSRPAVPNCPGLDEIGFRTADSIFSLEHPPRVLIVLGSGPDACELAQAFRRFGSEVHLLADTSGILAGEDRQAAALVQAQLERDGVRIHPAASVVAVRKIGRSKSVVVEQPGGKLELIADEILVAAGREPDVAGLDLENAGIHYSAAGVAVNDRLQTSHRAVYATGDVCAGFLAACDSDTMARVCVHNALFFGRQRIRRAGIARVIHTSPQLGQLGLTLEAAGRLGIELDHYRVELDEHDEAITSGAPRGLVTLYTRRGHGNILGATIVAAQAGEMLSQLSLLVAHGLPISAWSDGPHCRSAGSEAFRRLAEQFRSRRLTPGVRQLLDRWFTWRRRPRPARLEPATRAP